MARKTQKDALTLLGMEVRNILGIRFAALEFHDGLNRIGGENGQGKTSLRESAIMCLGGARYIPEEPVHRGAETGQVVLRFDRFVVERTVKPDRSTEYRLTTPDGKPFAGGSLKMLETFREAIAFDPQRFSNMQPREQADLLKKLVGLDFADLDARREQLVEERNAAGRDRKGREAQLLAMPTFPDAPAEEVSAVALAEELQEANRVNLANANTRRSVEARADVCKQTTEKIKHAKAQIKLWQDQLAALEKRYHAEQIAWDEENRALAVIADVDPGPIQARIAEAEVVNRKVRANLAHSQAKTRYEQAVEDYRALDKAIGEIDRQKAELVAQAKLPVEGIGFSESGVTFNGHPYAQASDAEKLRVSTAIGLALHPEFPNPWIQDGSLLDRKSLAMIEEMAQAAGGRVIVEVVTDDPARADIIIEDGAVKGAAQT